MRGIAKAIYSQGRFVSADGDVAVFLVENAPTRERAEKARAQVEELLGIEVGTALSIRIVDSPDAAASTVGPGDSARPGQVGRSRDRAPNDQGGPGSHRPPGAPPTPAVEPEASGHPLGSRGASRVDDDGPLTPPPVPSTPAPSPPPAPSVASMVDGGVPDPTHTGGSDDDDEMSINISDLEDATDVATTGLERLLEAFPGAKILETDTEAR